LHELQFYTATSPIRSHTHSDGIFAEKGIVFQEISHSGDFNFDQKMGNESALPNSNPSISPSGLNFLHPDCPNLFARSLHLAISVRMGDQMQGENGNLLRLVYDVECH